MRLYNVNTDIYCNYNNTTISINNYTIISLPIALPVELNVAKTYLINWNLIMLTCYNLNVDYITID